MVIIEPTISKWLSSSVAIPRTGHTFGVLFSQHERLGEVLQGGGQFRDSERATKPAKT
jgi:hypothetical protein